MSDFKALIFGTKKTAVAVADHASSLTKEKHVVIPYVAAGGEKISQYEVLTFKNWLMLCEQAGAPINSVYCTTAITA